MPKTIKRLNCYLNIRNYHVYNKQSFSLKKLKVDNPTLIFCLLALDLRILLQSINQYTPDISMTTCITKNK